MSSSVNMNPNPADPQSDTVAALKEAHEQIGRADEQIVRRQQGSSSERDAAGDALDQRKRAVPDRPRRLSDSRRALRGLLGLLLAACIAVAAFVSQSSYGEGARLTIARWTAPYLGLASSLFLPKRAPRDQPSPRTVGAATADAAPPQPAP